MILKLSKDKKLTFYRKNPIYIGEKDFNTIEVLISPTIDGNETNELNFILHLVNKDGEYLHIDLDKEIKEDIIVGSTEITTDITSVAQKFSVYIEMVKGNDEVIGKTNVLEIKVNPLPDEQGEIIPEEIEKRGVIIAQTNPPDSSHKKYRLGALWINYADETQYVLTDINKSQAPQEYGYVWNKVSNQTIISSDSAPEYTPNNVDYKYSVGDVWVQTDSNAEKIVAISVCTGNTKVTIDAQNWKYNYTWAVLTSGSNDYTDLTNKPSINNVTLSGNKSSDDLNLQGKLTAGNNITIENNVISAEGGVTSYNDLTDKPMIYDTWNPNGYSLSGENVLSSFIGTTVDADGKRIWRLTADIASLIASDSILFSQLDTLLQTNMVVTETPYQGSLNLDDIADYIDGKPNKIIPTEYIYPIPNIVKTHHGNFLVINIGELNVSAQILIWEDTQGKGHLGFRSKNAANFEWTDWQEIGADGFSPVATVTQTASGATISITDKNGTTTANISNGQDGNDYVLTAQDKSDIADIVLSELPTTQGVQYGN